MLLLHVILLVLCKWWAEIRGKARRWEGEMSVWSFSTIRVWDGWYVLTLFINNFALLKNRLSTTDSSIDKIIWTHMQLSTSVNLVPIVSTSSFSCFFSLPDGELYSATSLNFLGSDPVMMRSTGEIIRTDYWFNGEIMVMPQQTFNQLIAIPCNKPQRPGKHHLHFHIFSNAAFSAKRL